MVLVASFARRRGGRDHIYVTRSNGSTSDWAFPTYGDQLPHDLCHLVIEQELKIADGFWGLVEDGFEVPLVDNQRTLVKDGRPVTEHPDADLAGLAQAEAAVALLGPTGMGVRPVETLVDTSVGLIAPLVSVDTSTVATVHERLRRLGDQWRTLNDGGAITLEYVRS